MASGAKREPSLSTKALRTAKEKTCEESRRRAAAGEGTEPALR
ncbi:hypothetical protein TTRE_0000030601 [Trichuris trichiura]|uniref:Uncharacterized protein n=1 Tax=Trichuris trichiura TaxID=36087 RepID=A0A077YVB4_TRITR|nr:hypothetical protein TTRE_0000030601 [Trichuris trichiura]